MLPLISVIIPVYNMELYLSRCLDSVLNNTYRNLEVICIDDGSNDNSLEVLREYEQRDNRIIVIAKENGGVSSARNAGLDRMSGEYMTFVDSDDYLHPQFFSLLFEALQRTGSDVAAATYRDVFDLTPVAMQEHSFSEKLCSRIRLSSACCSRLMSLSCCKLTPCRLIGTTRFKPDVSFGEDSIFFLELWEKHPDTKFIIYSADLYFYYRPRTDSLSNSRRESNVLSFLSYLRKKAQTNQQIYLESTVRRCLYFRYHFTDVQKNSALRLQVGKLCRSCFFPVLQSACLNAKTKLGLALYILFPACYRSRMLKRNSKLREEAQGSRTNRN